MTSSTIMFGCNQGYSPQGTMTAECVATDTWSPDPAMLECTTNVAKGIVCIIIWNSCVNSCCIFHCDLLPSE